MFRSPLLILFFVAGLVPLSWAADTTQEVSYADGGTLERLPGSFPSDIELPQLGDPADTALSPMQEARLGAEVVSQLYAYEYLVEDPQLTDYLTATGWRLAAASDARPERLQIFVIKDDRINAFALPGGYMGFNAGLITASEHEGELAGVMAHELAHVTQRHIARGAASGGGLATIATWAAVLAAIIAGSADPNVILAALGIGQTISYQRQVAFTRAHEIEADRIGIQTLSEAGFDTRGMAGFFQTLEQQSRLYGNGVPEFLRTHPINTSRITEARARAAALPNAKAPDTIEYQLMKARTKVFAADQPSAALGTFTALIASGQDTPAHRYGKALALSRLGQNKRALETIQSTLDMYPTQINLLLLQAEIQAGAGDSEQALETYRRALERHPRAGAAILEYSEALIHHGQPEAARKILLAAEPSFGARVDVYRLLSLAARQMDNDAEASYQMATYLFMRGDAGGALSQLDAGLRLKSLNKQERARLIARRAEVRDALPRNWDPDRDDRNRRRR